MKSALALVAILLCSPRAAIRAEEPDALAIARKCDAALKGKTEHGSASMTVRTPEWQRALEMKFWYDYPQKTFIRIVAPAKDAGTGTLRLGSNMWTYLPTVERVIKVPPSLMLQSWMGSDFSNDDLVKESSLPTDYTHQIEGETIEDGDACYRLIATPKPNAPVVWGKLVLPSAKRISCPVAKSSTTIGAPYRKLCILIKSAEPARAITPCAGVWSRKISRATKLL